MNYQDFQDFVNELKQEGESNITVNKKSLEQKGWEFGEETPEKLNVYFRESDDTIRGHVEQTDGVLIADELGNGDAALSEIFEIGLDLVEDAIWNDCSTRNRTGLNEFGSWTSNILGQVRNDTDLEGCIDSLQSKTSYVFASLLKKIAEIKVMIG